MGADHSRRPVVAARCEERVSLRLPGDEGLVEPVELHLGRAATERPLVRAERHREYGARRVAADRPVDRLHQVRQALHALRLGGRHSQEHDVGFRRDGVGPLHVEVRLAGPAVGGRRAGLADPVPGGVLVVRHPDREDLLEVRRRPTECLCEEAKVFGGRRASVRVDEDDRLTRALRRASRQRAKSVPRPDVVRRVAVDRGGDTVVRRGSLAGDRRVGRPVGGERALGRLERERCHRGHCLGRGRRDGARDDARHPRHYEHSENEH